MYVRSFHTVVSLSIVLTVFINFILLRVFGAPITEEEWCKKEENCPPLILKENIVGLEAPLFSETTSDDDQMDDKIWPKILAIAERCWNEAEWEKFSQENSSTSFDHDFEE